MPHQQHPQGVGFDGHSPAYVRLDDQDRQILLIGLLSLIDNPNLSGPWHLRSATTRKALDLHRLLSGGETVVFVTKEAR
jgi:hypothetical protein